MVLRLLVLSLGLHGCASLGPRSVEGDPLALGLKQFTLDGKVSWRQGDDSGRAALGWVQDGARFRLVLTGPFGRGAAVLEGVAAAVTLTSGDRILEGPSANALLEAELGVPLPLEQAVYWVRGVPAPGPVRVQARDPAGWASAIRQAGWDVAWPRRATIDGMALPARIELTRDDVRVLIVAGRWQPGVAVFDAQGGGGV
ncbi:MAG: lipoprotein insertase outer membrane protein LolB [Pseudomonadales bacterium]|jgi:outer membrane lipoprotein LolB|nr:lipoprotein insertase outer membrane protein LolB [Pseudomonadales bacterium]